MPTRMLRDWTDSARIEKVSAQAERLFVRLIMKADDYGRFHADSRLVLAGCFPLVANVTSADVDAWMNELSGAKLIVLYESDGRRYLEIIRFDQRMRSKRSKFPASDGQGAVICPSHDGQVPVTCPSTDGLSYLDLEAKAETEARVGKPPQSADTHTPSWIPLEFENSIPQCTECLRTGHASFAKMAFGDMAKIENTLRNYDAETRAKAVNTLIADFAGDAPMKYAPAMQLRYALDNVLNPRAGTEPKRKPRLLS